MPKPDGRNQLKFHDAKLVVKQKKKVLLFKKSLNIFKTAC